MEGARGACSTNPHVVIAPLDVSSAKTYRFTALPASAALYNKPESSDIRLVVGNESFHAHRCILSAASDVFSAMLGSDWLPSGASSAYPAGATNESAANEVGSYRVARPAATELCNDESLSLPCGAATDDSLDALGPDTVSEPGSRALPGSMRGRGGGSRVAELELVEEPECARVFDRFLYFMYSGNVVIGDAYVVALYILADKYNVRALHDECAKVIQNGLKVLGHFTLSLWLSFT